MRLAIPLPTLLALLLAASAAGPARAGTIASLTTEEAEDLVVRTRKTPLVIVAQPVKVSEKGIAECQIVTVLKGGFERPTRTFRVRFAKVFGGAWPEPGVTAVYFLRPPPGTGGSVSDPGTLFELVSDREGLASPTGEVIAVVKLAAAGKYVLTSERDRATIKLPAPDSMLGTMLSAGFVALATVEEVDLSGKQGISAKMTCRVEAAFKGRMNPGRIVVDVPAVFHEARDVKRKPLCERVKAGPAVLMFVAEKDGSFRTVSAYRGWFPIPPGEGTASRARELAALLEEEIELRRRGLVGDPAGRTSIEQTLQLWQDRWNANEIENVVGCYSRRNKWRKEWESGLAGKKRLADVLAGFGRGGASDGKRAFMYVTLERIEPVQKGRVALAHVDITVITRDDLVERRPAVMTFVFEDGMWLILHEGD
jgi:hypothetical protein